MLDLPDDTGVSIAVGGILNYLLFIVDDMRVICKRDFGGLRSDCRDRKCQCLCIIAIELSIGSVPRGRHREIGTGMTHDMVFWDYDLMR